MKRIQTKIMVLVMVATLGISIINCIQSVVTTRSSTISAIEQTLMETTKLAAMSAQNMISTYTLTVAEIASNPILYSASSSQDEKQVFIQTKVDAYHMRFGGIADVNGYDAVHDADVSAEDFFIKAINGENYMSSTYKQEGDMFMVISAPIMQDGVVKGILYFQCDTYILQSIVQEIQIGEYGESYILDKNGTTIACGNEQNALEQENAIQEAKTNPDDKDIQTLAAIEQKMVAGESGIAKYAYEEDNSNNIQGYAPIPGTDGWSVAVTLDEDEFMQTAYTDSNIQVAVSVTLCIIVILISAAVSHSIASPIVKCTNRLRSLSEGDLKSPVPNVASRDEVHVLSDSIGHLIENLGVMLTEIGTVLGGIANGDLTRDTVSSNYPGDFKDLYNYLQVISEKLNTTMSSIVDTASGVSGGAAQMASTSYALSQGAMAQSSAVEELSVTMRDMDSDAKQTAILSQETKEAVDCAGTQLQESKEYIENLNQVMNLIMASTSEISRIIDTIEDIALQTNILSLNASVEASRAGAAGKGFAVVAGEIRDLAAKSDQSAKATLDLIRHSTEAVNSGSAAVEKVTESVMNVVELSAQTAERMDIVAQAVERQTGSISQVSEALSQISNVVQTNTATSQESASISSELSEQAATLTRLVNGFLLRK